ncbi:hypothetical protein E4U55_005879 [Claviceps digitariae]|nr:hypothetical protein E4U55_005879 [Claviceps digitariae]
MALASCQHRASYCQVGSGSNLLAMRHLRSDYTAFEGGTGWRRRRKDLGARHFQSRMCSLLRPFPMYEHLLSPELVSTSVLKVSNQGGLGFGCLVGSFQTKVRSLYGIGGNACLDQCDGIVCPCFAMIRVEQEILLREQQRKRLVGSHIRQYQRHDPMSYLRPESAMTRPSSKETSSSLDTTPAYSLSKHSLDDHQVMPAGNVPSPHNLEADATVPPLPKTTVSGHHVCRDPLTNLAHPAVSHDLSADKTTHFVNLDYDHNLGRDVLAASSGAGRTIGHGLPAHKPSQVSVIRPAHRLSDDTTISSESRSGTGHVHDEHAKQDTTNKETSTKHMSDGDASVTATGNEVGSSKIED